MSLPSNTLDPVAAWHRAALFGGAFDPVHSGHIALARHAAEALSLDGVLLMPSWDSPHKGRHILPAKERLALCRLAAEAFSDISVSSLECDERISYTADSLRLLHRRYPGVKWTLLLGEDAFQSLPRWKDSSVICALSRIAVGRRPASGVRGAERARLELERLGAHVTVLDTVLPPVSSTQIRAAAARNESLTGMVPEAVERRIRLHQLYQAEEAYL